MHVSRIRAIGTAVGLLLVATSLAQAQGIKIGVFDPARVSEEAVEARRLQAELEAIRDTKQAEITAQEQEVAALQQRLQQQALSLSPDKRTTLQIDIQRKMLSLNKSKELASQELQLEFSAAEAKFNEKLRSVVEQFGREEGFSIILDAQAVAWASNAVDVTTPIVDRFNRMFPVASAAAPTP